MEDNEQIQGESQGKLVPMHVQWHKICALLIFKMGGTQHITPLDIVEMEKKHPNGAVLLQDQEDGLHLTLISHEQAEKLVAEQAVKDAAPQVAPEENVIPIVTGTSTRKISEIGAKN